MRTMSQLEHLDLEANQSLTPENPIPETSETEVLETASLEAAVSDEPVDGGSAENKPHLNAELEALLKELEGESNSDNKLQKTIAFMEQSLSQGKTPHFKSFWGARDLSLQLFKENISPGLRSILWSKYSDLSKEARRLKELLDEQSAFAVEQIEMAIQALEYELTKTDQDLQTAPVLPIESQALQANASTYAKMQRELDNLNIQASRINALRKELIKTEMRIRKKNQFFQRLSAAGDSVFPRRKELIHEVSSLFIQDVDKFVTHFEGKPTVPFYSLREEIKALQSLAKVLTLNSTAFAHTRLRLSECWDKIKQLDKERKHEQAQKKTVYKENMDAVSEQLDALSLEIQEGKIGASETQKKLDDISYFMRGVELGREEVHALRERMQQIRQPLLDQQRQEEQVKIDNEKERQRQKRQKVIDLKEEVDTLLNSAATYNAEELIAQRNSVVEKINSSAILKSEKMELERLLKPLKDIITEKKEQAMLSLSSGDREALQQLNEVLQQRKERRQEIKDQLEQLRKAAGLSGLDFEKAIAYQQQLAEEKERLEKINQGIEEIEDRIHALRKR